MAAKKSPYGRVVLVTGPEALLAERAVSEWLESARAEEPDAELTDVDAIRLDSGALAAASGGSLFASQAILIIRDLANLPVELVDQVAALVTDPLPELAMICVHGGGNKGKGLLDKIKKTKGEVVDCPALKPRELPQFVNGEVRRAGARIDTDATQFLIDAVGHDLRSLAGAIAQLVDDGEGGAITQTEVRRYFGGRAEVTSFVVADSALAGKTTPALEQLRWALSTGVAPVLVTSALASGLRGLGKLASNRSGMNDNDLARDIGVPPWKLRTMRQQVRGWDQGGLAQAIQAVAAADGDIKGAAADPAFALERCVLAVSHAATCLRSEA